jgi:hypothetical protein
MSQVSNVKSGGSESEEVNARLQRYLENRDVDENDETTVTTFDPLANLQTLVDDWNRLAKARRLFVCARKRQHGPTCRNSKGVCNCDSDDAFSIRSVKFEVNSNCRAALQMMFTPDSCMVGGEFLECARVFSLKAAKTAAEMEDENPLADIDPSPERFLWVGMSHHHNHKKIKPKPAPSAAKPKPSAAAAATAGGNPNKTEKQHVASTPDNKLSFLIATTKVDPDSDTEKFHGQLRLPGLAFNLTDAPRYSETEVIIQVDYMSFMNDPSRTF